MPGLIGTYGRQWYVDVPAQNPLVRFVMISPALTFPDGTYQYTAGSARYAWTAAAIDGARSTWIPWVVVGVRKPCLWVGEYGCDPGTDLIDMLVSKKVDLVLTGHEHLYQRTAQLALGPGCPGLTPGVFTAACVADGGSSLVHGAGTVFATVGTGGQIQRPIHPDDPEAPYFVATSGSATATWGLLDVQATATTLTAQFVRASGGTFTDAFTIGPPGANTPPTASFTASCTELDCTVDGSASSDPDGVVVGYAWDFGDGSTGSGATASHAFATAGTYTIGLTVTDDGGATATTTDAVTVTAPTGNTPPTASLTASCTELDCTVDGSASSDPDGAVVGYAWDFGDGSTGSGATASHAFATAGTYTIGLTVTDDGGATATTTDSVTVTASTGGAFAADAFERSVTNGLGTADTGGAWQTTGNPSRFSVAGGAGNLDLAQAMLLGAALPAVSSSSTDLVVGVALAAARRGRRRCRKVCDHSIETIRHEEAAVARTDVSVDRLWAGDRGRPAFLPTGAPVLSWSVGTQIPDWEQASAVLELRLGATTASHRVDGHASLRVAWPFLPLGAHERAAVRVSVVGTDGSRSGPSAWLDLVTGPLGADDWRGELIGATQARPELATVRVRTVVDVRRVWPRRHSRPPRTACTRRCWASGRRGRGDDTRLDRLRPIACRSRPSTSATCWSPGADRAGSDRRRGLVRRAVRFMGGHAALDRAASVRRSAPDGRRGRSGHDGGTDASWRASVTGPVTSAGIYQGESYDARRADTALEDPDVALPHGDPAVVVPGDLPRLVPAVSPPVRTHEELAVQQVLTARRGRRSSTSARTWSGWLRLRVAGPAGTR